MNNYDIFIVGASTTGCWFAKEMASQGFKVLVVEKNVEDKVSREYDIFHMDELEMKSIGLTIPEDDNPIREFRFENTNMSSPYSGSTVACGYSPVIGMHKHDYIMAMADEAKAEGAEFIYGASFSDFIYDDNKKIIGAKYITADGEQEVCSKLVADCSGIPSAARTKLPDTSVVENFKLSVKDILYVVLYYVTYSDKSINPDELNAFYMQYKSWFAPAGKGYDGLMGIGAFYSYKYAEYVFENHFSRNVKIPKYTLHKIEKGMTPYHRNLFSTVDDGFIAMGDTAFLTKPTCGEGCTSSLVHGLIASEVIGDLLRDNKPLTKENMWSINARYMKGQGKEFDSMRALLKGVITISYDEAEYMFNNKILFCEAILGGMGKELQLSGKELAQIITGIGKGVAKGKLKPSTIKNLVVALSNSEKINKLYDKYPETFEGFEDWRKEAEKIWRTIGKLADACDKDILAEIIKK